MVDVPFPDRNLLFTQITFNELKSILLWEHLAARLYLAFIESTISEHSARLQTMDSAISNLDQRVGDLEIKCHTIHHEKRF